MISVEVLLRSYRLMLRARAMGATYEANRNICRYVHSTSRGHEAIQIAAGLQLKSFDYVSPYYRDDSMLLAMGFTATELMMQLLAKAGDPFSGGRSYYAHPSNRGNDKPAIIHQSSATGMQVIPATGIAQGLKYIENYLPEKLSKTTEGELPVVLCSLGDASVTEGEVSEAFQFAALKQLPVIFLVQDNEWGISVSAQEARVSDAFEFTGGLTGLNRVRVNGSDFVESYECLEQVITEVRTKRIPYLIHATVPLLGHHTSGVRKEFYRSSADLAKHAEHDPLPILKDRLSEHGISNEELAEIEKEINLQITEQFKRVVASPELDPSTVYDHVFAPTSITEETGERVPSGSEKVMMVDAALHAIRELMEKHEEMILFGQDVGRRLGGVFREAVTLAERFGDHRVFNTAIQEAYIIGSTAGLSATGLKPVVEIQFGDYIFPGINQLATEVAKSCYLSNGKFPVQTLIRVPVGAYGGGGPYHSASIESLLLSIKGIKVVYPSNAADIKGLMKAAFYDPNPVVMLEHKGLYWSKVPGTEDARRIEPSADYIVPLGKALRVLYADENKIKQGDTCCVITYGMGVYWSLTAAKSFPRQIEIVDLRTLFPLDETMIYETVKRHGKCLIVTEEAVSNSFAQSLAGRISHECFQFLDLPVEVCGAADLPALPINPSLENAALPGADAVRSAMNLLLNS